MARIDSFFKYARYNNASDLHLSVGNVPLIRIHGVLVPIKWQELTPEMIKDLLYEILTEDQIAELEETLDLDFSYGLPEGDIRFRGNIFVDRRGLGAVFRVIPTKIPTLEQLGLPETVLKFADYRTGLVLITGATGSGKTTTINTIIDYINHHREEHIITIEDPIEFVHESQRCLVNQREVGRHTKSFASAIRAALREDPDVIVVGEMRDLETIELAINAAETGHLVLGTLHTSSAATSVDRIINVFPSMQQDQIRTMISTSLRGVISQQLCRSLDGRRRYAAVEIMVNTPSIANLIREGKTHLMTSMIQTGIQEGMQLMDQSLQSLVEQRKISPQEALARCTDKKTFQVFLDNLKGGR